MLGVYFPISLFLLSYILYSSYSNHFLGLEKIENLTINKIDAKISECNIKIKSEKLLLIAEENSMWLSIERNKFITIENSGEYNKIFIFKLIIYIDKLLKINKKIIFLLEFLNKKSETMNIKNLISYLENNQIYNNEYLKETNQNIKSIIVSIKNLNLQLLNEFTEISKNVNTHDKKEYDKKHTKNSIYIAKLINKLSSILSYINCLTNYENNIVMNIYYMNV
ncbi:hypothetical protein CWI38_0077p0010 [Hamiltosporidium tvaerminnensis]|uniref:Uncharacterized protein n=2 Tax=Hamiltosporidium tvaerminnensis TaxID=1176355 RepID=A0A4Q9LNS7_9MICR|nr:hypothetical protein CWI37_2253p0010 [Hamiltosporidium tvaerminnensis]TBU10068.1 hypothetical protein CWI38_2049p0010 [Hamiltosporidium tvaerminnensis]TBU20391.1 hypothetical protein CWI38_0077p0010 [Hamiltosporidium tvaerminnensis]